MRYSENFNVRALYSNLLRHDNFLLRLCLKQTIIRGFRNPGDVDDQMMEITLRIPTRVLPQPLLCALHIRSILSNFGPGLPLDICIQLAHHFSRIAWRLIAHNEAVDHRDRTYNGFILTAVIDITVWDNDFLGLQAIASSSNLSVINDDDQVIIFDEVMNTGISTSSSSSQTTSINGSTASRLGAIDKLRRSEHEVVNARADNVRDQLADGGCCAICLEDYSYGGTDENRELVRFGCAHLYHLTCILQWLDVKDSCPLCRRQLFKPS